MPISMLYHDVTPPNADDVSGFPGPAAARYKLTRSEFGRHLDRIENVVAAGPLATTDPNELRKSRNTDWLITFDDGGVSAATVIADSLEQRGWRGWFFIATDFIGRSGFCNRSQIEDLHRRGHVIGSHSCSHPERISACSPQQLLDEWQRSRNLLSEIINAPVTSASVPGGFYSQQVAFAAIESGLTVLFNSEPTTTSIALNNAVVLGRYNVYRGMSCEDAAALISSPIRRWRQSAFWSMKKVAKTVAGPVYKSIRQTALNFAYAETQSAGELSKPVAYPSQVLHGK